MQTPERPWTDARSEEDIRGSPYDRWKSWQGSVKGGRVAGQSTSTDLLLIFKESAGIKGRRSRLYRDAQRQQIANGLHRERPKYPLGCSGLRPSRIEPRSGCVTIQNHRVILMSGGLNQLSIHPGIALKACHHIWADIGRRQTPADHHVFRGKWLRVSRGRRMRKRLGFFHRQREQLLSQVSSGIWNV